MEARRVHNPKAAGSNPAPTTKEKTGGAILCSLYYLKSCLFDPYTMVKGN